MKKLNIEEVIRKNPRVSRDAFDAADQVSRQMQKEGARRQEYRVAGPGAGKPVKLGASGKEDPRTFHLK